MNRHFFGPGYIQDGKLDSNTGRIVIYDDTILVSRNFANDHNELIRGLARRVGRDYHDVISKAIRLYYRYDSGNSAYVICGVREIDNQMFEQNSKLYSQLIKQELQ